VDLNAIRVPDGVDEAATRKQLLHEFNIEIGAGLGPLAGRIWRVGLMGAGSTSQTIVFLLGRRARAGDRALSVLAGRRHRRGARALDARCDAHARRLSVAPPPRPRSCSAVLAPGGSRCPTSVRLHHQSQTTAFIELAPARHARATTASPRAAVGAMIASRRI
jgi:hypothetical protein